DYTSDEYTARRISDWCRSTLELQIPAEQLADEDARYLERRIREKAKDEIRDAVRTSLGEYVDPEDPPQQWDIGGLLRWAQRTFDLNATQNQLRKLSPPEIEELLIEAADAHYDTIDLSP